LCNTASEANPPHETTATDSLKTLGKTLAEFQKKGIVVPNILQAIRGHVTKDKIRHCLTNAAKRIRTIGKNAKDG
jgi:hypothetical protein